MMSIDWEFKLRKRRGGVFEKTTMISLTCLEERKGNYISIQRKHSIRFTQNLLVKEILSNGRWRLDFSSPQHSLLLSWLNT